jgi:Zn-dependent M28 family amino/carboxypeptidase
LYNILVRVNDKSKSPNRDSILLNSHYDSYFPSPGAGDNGLGVSVNLEIFRNILSDNNLILKNPLIFLFNTGNKYFYLNRRRIRFIRIKSIYARK